MVADDGSPDRVERNIFSVILGMFLANSGRFWNPFLGTNNLSEAHLMKIERLVAYVTPVSSLDRAKRDFLGRFLGVFWQIRAVLW